MKVQTKSELECEKKELGRLHKLASLKGTSESRNPRSISIVSASSTTKDRDHSDAAINMARAADVFFLRRGQVLQ